jgi:cytochrome P450 family 4
MIDGVRKYNVKEPKVVYGLMSIFIELGIFTGRHIEQILTTPSFITKSSMYKMLGDMLGDGLLFSTNQKWFVRRRIITPTFHFKILEQFFDVFKKHSGILLEQLKPQASKDHVFDISPYVSLSVLKSLCGKSFSLPRARVNKIHSKNNHQKRQWDVR